MRREKGKVKGLWAGGASNFGRISDFFTFLRSACFIADKFRATLQTWPKLLTLRDSPINAQRASFSNNLFSFRQFRSNNFQRPRRLSTRFPSFHSLDGPTAGCENAVSAELGHMTATAPAPASAAAAAGREGSNEIWNRSEQLQGKSGKVPTPDSPFSLL